MSARKKKPAIPTFIGVLILLALAGCAGLPTPTKPSVSVQVMTMTPTPTVLPTAMIAATPTLAIATVAPSPTPATWWVEYWDQRYGYGLAVPCHWKIYPTPLTGQLATLTLANYDITSANVNLGTVMTEAVKIELFVYAGVDPAISLTEIARTRLESDSAVPLTILSLEERPYGSHQAVWALIEHAGDLHQQYRQVFFRIAPDKVLSGRVIPEEAWQSGDILAILSSLAFSQQEKIAVPSIAPASPLSETSACSLTTELHPRASHHRSTRALL